MQQTLICVFLYCVFINFIFVFLTSDQECNSGMQKRIHFRTDMEHHMCRPVNNSDVFLGYQFCKNITFILYIIYNIRYNNIKQCAMRTRLKPVVNSCALERLAVYNVLFIRHFWRYIEVNWRRTYNIMAKGKRTMIYIKRKNLRSSNTKPTKNRKRSQVLRKGDHFLLL